MKIRIEEMEKEIFETKERHFPKNRKFKRMIQDRKEERKFKREKKYFGFSDNQILL